MSFLVSIPSEQLLRPAQRRSLMRRALAGLVPHEVLFRKTKWLAKRQPYLMLIEAWPLVLSLMEGSECASRGFIDSALLMDSLKQAIHGKRIFQLRVFKALGLEMWLRELVDRGLVRPGRSEGYSSRAGGFARPEISSAS